MGKDLINKIERMDQWKKKDEEEKLHAKEILKDTNKHLNNEYYYHTNQQLICHKDVFRGAIVKDWVVGNSNSVNVYLCNNFFIEQCINCYH